MTVFYFLTKVSGPFQGGRVEDNDDISLFCHERSFLYSLGHTKKKMLVCSFAAQKNNQNSIWGGGSFRMGSKKGRRGEFRVWFVCFPHPHYGFGVRFLLLLLLLLLLFFTVFEKTATMYGRRDGSRNSRQWQWSGGGYSFVDYPVSVWLFLLLSSFVRFFYLLPLCLTHYISHTLSSTLLHSLLPNNLISFLCYLLLPVYLYILRTETELINQMWQPKPNKTIKTHGKYK